MNTNTFLRYTILGGLLLALFVTPFIVSSGLFFPYIAGKGFFFRFIIEICFAIWVLLLSRNAKYWPKKSQLLYAVLAFIVILALSTIFSVNPARSFWSNFERMEGLVSYLHLFAYFIMLVSLMGAVDGEERKRDWHIVLYTTVAASAFMALYGLAQMGNHSLISSQSGPRVDGRFGNAAYMAVYMLIHVFLIVYLSLKRHLSHWLTWCLGGLAVLEFIVLAYTQTRGAFYGTIIGIILVLAIVAIQKGGTWRKATVGSLIILALLGGGMYAARNSAFVKSSSMLDRLLSVSLSDRTVESRTTIWGMAVEGIQEHPILGYGLDNFNLVFNKYYKSSLFNQEQWFDRAHNVFFDWLSAAGILGLLSYLSLFVIAIVVIWKRKSGIHEERAVLTGLLAAYFIHNFFVFDNLLSSVLFFTLLAYLTTSDQHHKQEAVSDAREPRKDPTVRYAVGTVVFFLMFPIINVVTVKPYFAGKTLITAISPCVKVVVQDGKNVCAESRQAAAERQIEAFDKLFAMNTFAKSEAREQLVQAALQTGGNEQVSAETRDRFLRLAQQQMTMQITETPNDARYRLFMGMFYRSVGHLELAIPELETAVKLTPAKPAMLDNLAQLYAEAKDMPKALETAKTAYNLEKRNQEAGRLLFAIYLQMGKRQEAAAVLQEMIENIPDFKERGEKYLADVKAGRNP